MSIRSSLVGEMPPSGSGAVVLQATDPGFHDFRNFVGGGGGGVLLKAAENGEDGVAYSDFSHIVQAAGVTDLLAGGVFIRATRPCFKNGNA